MTFRPLDPGMGEGVAARTVLRTRPDGTRETWRDVAERVADGNTLLVPGSERDRADFAEHIAQGRILMSGRHLQHGDGAQPMRNIELLSNCSTAATSFVQFYLLLNGSGVGRSYNDELMLVNWDHMPNVSVTLDPEHADYSKFPTVTPSALRHFLPDALVLMVPDSREGWAQALELVEMRTWQRNPQPIILDFSGVRPAGSPIGGMQDRPSSGPVPLMGAFIAIQDVVKGKGMAPWEQNLRVDHEFAAVVLVGGARRAARMAVKDYRDPGAERFVNIKNEGGLWTANHSLGVDRAFWENAEIDDSREHHLLEAVLDAQYHYGSGEPGTINLDKLHCDRTGLEAYAHGQRFVGSDRYDPSPTAHALYQVLAGVALQMQYPMIVNPCGEIPLLCLGAYCVLGDVVPFHADTLAQAEDAIRHTVRALIRTNTMPAFYRVELDRTNRIGVSLTGIHEWAYDAFGLTWNDYTGPEGSAFQMALRTLKAAAVHEAAVYSAALNVAMPHTVTTIKPAGSTSKLFGLTEGAHLPAKTFYIRWVQYKQGDPLIDELEAQGYPVQREIPGTHYTGMSIVGFPTAPMLARLGIPESQLVTAEAAPLDEQYAWVRMLESCWLGLDHGAQVSYTAKWSKSVLSRQVYGDLLRRHQPTVRCTALIASDDWRETARLYGYSPEEPVSAAVFAEVLEKIINRAEERVTLEELACAGGACPL